MIGRRPPLDVVLAVACVAGSCAAYTTGASTPVPPAAEPSSRSVAASAQASLALPPHVDVVLSAYEGATSIEWTDERGARGTARDATSLRGPVKLGQRTYDGEIFVERRSEGGLQVVVRAPLEDYVEGVVAAELAIWSARPAELEAQAIAARTFAAATIAQRRRAGLDDRLTDGVLDQAYRGRHVASDTRGGRDAAARLRAAVRATEGVVLTRGAQLEEARYHAACGGHTAPFADVFRREVRERGARGPGGVPCPACAERARRETEAKAPDPTRPLAWIAEVPAERLEALGRSVDLDGPPIQLVPVRVDPAGRWLDVALRDASGTTRTVPFDDFRRAIGYGLWKSGVVAATVPRPGAALRGGSLRVQGRGRGHGVGLCQEGMRDLADEGWTSREILAHYYPGARLETAAIVAP
ncbi:MAG: SpoIID/LytB domain-containing protein [Planctomycetota bacterium]